jgi:hypothetical protein
VTISTRTLFTSQLCIFVVGVFPILSEISFQEWTILWALLIVIGLLLIIVVTPVGLGVLLLLLLLDREFVIYEYFSAFSKQLL